MCRESETLSHRNPVVAAWEKAWLEAEAEIFEKYFWQPYLEHKKRDHWLHNGFGEVNAHLR